MKGQQIPLLPGGVTVLAVLALSVLARTSAIASAADDKKPKAASSESLPSRAAQEFARLNEKHDKSKLDYRKKGQTFKKHYREFANQHVGTPEGLKALFWLLSNCWWLRSEDRSEMYAAAEKLAQEIFSKYPDAKGLSEFVYRSYVLNATMREDVFGKLRKSSHRVVRASGTLGLARESQRGRNEEKSKKYYQELVDDYGDVKLRYTTYGRVAHAVLNKHPAETLEVGKVAPEIVGSSANGDPMKLSDYRGRVVVLDFWGDW